ncbi:MAG: TetR family transcriptional regulator [Salinibacterium sp.]|nr:TetR family transcriptional regulator [Salinibacterium sp.]
MTRIRPTERRVMLVQAAIRVIAAQGVAGATTRAIVAEAGMSLASFHYAFRSHAELMREVVSYVVDAEITSVFSSLRLGTDIRRALRDGLQAYLDYLIADPEHEQAMQELMHYALRTPGLESLAAEQYSAYLSGVVDVLTESAAAVPVEWAIPLPDIARLVVMTTHGVTLAWLADRDTAAAERVLDFAADSLAALAVLPIRSVT